MRLTIHQLHAALIIALSTARVTANVKIVKPGDDPAHLSIDQNVLMITPDDLEALSSTEGGTGEGWRLDRLIVIPGYQEVPEHTDYEEVAKNTSASQIVVEAVKALVEERLKQFAFEPDNEFSDEDMTGECDECGAIIPTAAGEGVNLHHADHCSLHSSNVSPVGPLVPETGAPVTEVRLCETRFLDLRPNQLYLFTVDPNCTKCVEANAPYVEQAKEIAAQPSKSL